MEPQSQEYDQQLQYADTFPGFIMQSEGFYLKFIAGLQRGVSNRRQEYETDWFEVMEILLSRLEDEPENKEQFEMTATRDLERWARMQLKMQVSLEENGSRIRLIIKGNRLMPQTEVIFYVKKKTLLKSLKDLAAEGVADHLSSEESIIKLGGVIPNSLILSVQRAFQNSWTHPKKSKFVKGPKNKRGITNINKSDEKGNQGDTKVTRKSKRKDIRAITTMAICR